MNPRTINPTQAHVLDTIDESLLAPSWGLLQTLEPELTALLDHVRSADDGGSDFFCGDILWHFEAKPILVHLVGWHRRGGPPVLKTEGAYEMAYRHLCKALPPCRNCACYGE